MRRIAVIVVLSVLMVVFSGCDKIKTELARRHLGTESCKQTPMVEKTPDHADDKQVKVEAPSVSKQIVIRIDLPADEKLQIRLVKLPVSEETPNDEEKSNDVVNPTNETSPKEPDKKLPKELETPKDEVPRSEIKTDADEEPKSEMKTVREEPLPAVIPAPAPMVIVPARETASEPISPDMDEMPALSRFVKSNPSPAEAAVGSALSVPPPATSSPMPNEPSNNAAVIEPKTSSAVNPWAIPNAEYPLRYY